VNRVLAIAFVLFSFCGFSHEIRPAYLQITETGENTFDVYWRIPSRGDATPKLEVIFPNSSKIKETSPPRFVDGFANFRYELVSKEPLSGKELRIEGLKNTLIDVLVRLEYTSGEQVTFMLQPDNDKVVVPGETSLLQVIEVYTILGIEHILFGFDHLLFVLALIIIAKGKWKIVKTVTAFTVAHSITLSLASLDLLIFPGAPVEAVIALSIVFLAVEILNVQQGKPSLTSKKPWLVAFTFGLLHGFGFAGALAEIGLPKQAIPYALGFFNVGVELGQLAFVFVMLGVFKILSSLKLNLEWGKKVMAYGIGSLAAFWMIERVVGFWG
jgi:hydrogenase/urease accessory protein HupE